MVEGSGLENRRGGDFTGGSNPSLSAIALLSFTSYADYSAFGAIKLNSF